MSSTPEAEARPTRVGLFGGTFDPPHVGHIRVAKDVADALDLDRLIWMPAGRPPHKLEAHLSSAADRLALTEAAAALDPRFEAGTAELDRPGPSYTVDTLRGLRESLPDAEIFLILGADQYGTFDAWHEPDEILRLASLAVMDRDGASARDLPCGAVARAGRPSPAVFVPVGRVDVSSTQVRRAARSGSELGGLVPGPVLEVIRARGLYRAAAGRP